jgi:type I restriction-modification system DNA methylase subunit
VINLFDHNNWDRTNGTLSVSLNPNIQETDTSLYVVLNGNVGNFCLDYTADNFDLKLAKQRAWSSDTGFYVKLDPNKVTLAKWWDDFPDVLPYQTVQENPRKFYNALIKLTPQLPSGVVSFAKEAFVKLRNCILLADNGQASLRVFMYLLAALTEKVEKPERVDRGKWHLKEFNFDWISKDDWDWLYNTFKKGTNEIPPLLELILRHASNRLFQEAHREATRKDFQTALWGGSDRIYNSGISDGAFYTPTSLVRTIVQESIIALNKAKPLSERQSLRILDPACGSAEFLREILRQLKIQKYKGKIHVSGWDISEIACEMSNFILHFENNSEWDGNVDINIQNRDSLSIDWTKEKPFDVILMNPPFRSFENLGQRKNIIVHQLGGIIKGQPDLSSVFWVRASEVLSIDGVLGLILPHSLLVAETYSKLRTHIKENLGMEFSLIARLGSSGLFEKAMIIPAVLIGTKNSRSYSHTLMWTDHHQTSVYTALRELRIYRQKEIPTPVVHKNFSIYENECLTKGSNWMVRSFQLNQLSERLQGFSNVGKLFDVVRGADTGNNAAFIWTRERLSQLPKKERMFFRPCVMRDSINKGRLVDKFYMFFPYGEFQIFSEDELYRSLPIYSSELKKYKDQLRKRKGNEEKWWELSRHRPWQIDSQPKLVSAYFGKSGYFAFDQKGQYLIGQSFAWFPKKEELNKDIYYFSYLALLHSSLIDKLLEMTCNILQGGYFDLSKHYVDKLPFPDLTNADISILSILAQIGENIHFGNEINISSLNETVANVYGISIESVKMES